MVRHPEPMPQRQGDLLAGLSWYVENLHLDVRHLR
jgi:hypothetical protein